MSRIDELIAERCPNGVEFKALGELVRIRNGKDYKAFGGGSVPVYGTGGIMTYIDTSAYDKPSVLIPRKGSLDKLYFVEVPFWTVDTLFFTEIGDKLVPKFLYYFLLTRHLEEMNQAGGVPSLTQTALNPLRIPIPPLEVQQEIVNVLDLFTELETELEAELDARKKQYEHYRTQLLTFTQGEVQRVPLTQIINFMNGKGHEKHIDENGKYIVVNSKFVSTEGRVRKYSVKQISPIFENDILMVMSDLPNGKALAKCFYVDEDDKYTLNQRICALTIKNKNELDARYLFYILNRNIQLLRYDNGTDQTNLRKGDILKIEVPVPEITEQKRIATILDKFDVLVSDISIGLPAELKARRLQYEYYRGKLLTFNEYAQ